MFRAPREIESNQIKFFALRAKSNQIKFFALRAKSNQIKRAPSPRSGAKSLFYLLSHTHTHTNTLEHMLALRARSALRAGGAFRRETEMVISGARVTRKQTRIKSIFRAPREIESNQISRASREIKSNECEQSITCSRFALAARSARGGRSEGKPKWSFRVPE